MYYQPNTNVLIIIINKHFRCQRKKVVKNIWLINLTDIIQSFEYKTKINLASFLTFSKHRFTKR